LIHACKVLEAKERPDVMKKTTTLVRTLDPVDRLRRAQRHRRWRPMMAVLALVFASASIWGLIVWAISFVTR
jgi:hypothetical protein